jgi:hypothetical protein
MARLTVGQKAQRVLVFLMGLANPANLRALQQYGFDQTALDEGWALLRRSASSRLGVPRVTAAKRDHVERLDAWENHWFPISAAVLQRNHPAAYAVVFHNLSQTEGNEVVLSVGTFLERLSELAASGDTAVMTTLSKHGLTEEVLGEARGLLDQMMQPPAEEAPPAGAAHVFDREAEDAMWSYYLQWSAIARRAITDRRLLRQLGFLRSTGGSATEGELPAGDAPDAPDSPAPASR